MKSNEDNFQLGIKAIIRNSEGKILLLKANLSTFKSFFPEHWDLPGGRLQKGDDIKKTLEREILEEIGVKKIKIIKLLNASISKMRLSYVDSGLIIFTYLCEIKSNQKIKLTDDEHTDFNWFTPAKAAKLLKTKFSDSLVNLVKDLA